MNIVQTELAIASFATAISTATIVAYFNYRSRVQDSFYERSRRVYGKIQKGDLITWRTLDSFAGLLLLPCFVVIFYNVSGAAFSGWIYHIDKDAFRFSVVLPALMFWVYVGLSTIGMRFYWHVTRSSEGEQVEEKLNEFDTSVSKLETIIEPLFRPGDVCVVGGKYKVVDSTTRMKTGEIRLRKGQQFPSLSNGSMIYLKMD